MKSMVIPACGLQGALLLLVSTLAFAQPVPSTSSHGSATDRGVRFTANKGQIVDIDGRARPDIRYVAQSAGMSLFLADNRISYVFSKIEGDHHAYMQCDGRCDADAPEPIEHGYRIDLEFVGANPRPEISSERPGSDYTNYYLAHMPQGITGVRSYSTVTYRNLYPQIDFVLRSSGTSLKYDFVVHPGGRVSDIRLRYVGATDRQLRSDGSIVTSTPLGTLNEEAPYSYEESAPGAHAVDGGKPAVVPSRYRLVDGIITFDVGEYDATRTLVIDPTQIWSTYYGGVGVEQLTGGDASEVDRSGSILFTGRTNNSAFPTTTGAFQRTLAGSYDVVIVKMSSTGEQVWATLYGGTGEDLGHGIVTDRSRNVFVAGHTHSNDFPTLNAHDNSYGGNRDAFAIKLDSNGTRKWATYYGGGQLDDSYGFAIDSTDNPAMIGTTNSNDGTVATSGAFQTVYGGGSYDAFLVKFNSTGVRQWGTFYGGNGLDDGYAAATDIYDNINITGWTNSTNFPVTSGAFQTTRRGVYDLFVARLTSAGSRRWGTYFGGSDNDGAHPTRVGFVAIATDTSGNAIIAGATRSTDLPVSSGALQSTLGGGTFDALIAKFDSTGGRIWSTYYGGSGDDFAQGVATNNSSSVLVTGHTLSTNFPGITSDAYSSSNGGGSDAFIVKLNSSGSTRRYVTYYGGSGNDEGVGISFDPFGSIVVAGISASSNFPTTTGAYQTSYGGNTDAFLALFCDIEGSIIDTSGPTTLCNGDSVTLSVPVGYSSYRWQSTTSSNISTSNRITVREAGSYWVYLSNAAGCTAYSDTIRVTMAPAADPTISPSGNQSICNGGSVTLTVGPRTFSAYRWYNGTTLLDSTRSSLVVTQAGVYRAIITDTTGCLDTTSSVTVTVGTAPSPVTITPPGPVSLCGTETVTLTASSTSGTVRWSNGATGQSIVVGTTGNYSAIVVDPVSGCSSVVSNVVRVTKNPLPNVIATNLRPLTFCDGDSTILAPSSTAGITSYLWMPGGRTSDTIHVKGTGTYTLTVTDTNGCSATSTISTSLLPRPAPTLRADTTICQGTSITLDAGAGYSTYRWSTGSTSRTISVSTAGNYHVAVTNAAGCEGLSDTVTIGLSPIPVVALTGPDSVCAWTTALYTVSRESNTTYTWSVSGGGSSVLSGGGANDTSVVVRWGAGGTGRVSVRSTNAAGCFASDSIDVARYADPNPVISPSTTQEFCEGGSVTLTVGPRAFASYAWYDSTLSTPLGNTTSSMTATTAGTYRVIVTDYTGCRDTSNAVRVIVNPKPSAVTLSPAGPIELCGSDSATITASTTTQGIIHWSTGTTGQSISVRQTGNYSAIVVNPTTGCSSAVSNIVRVVVNPLPDVTIQNLRPLDFCEGDSTILAPSSTAGIASYLWMPGGETTDTIHVKRSGTYTLRVTDTNGCSVTSTVSTSVLQRLAPTLRADTTICQGTSITLDAGAGYSTYRWSNGSTSRTISVSTSGEYYVTVTNASGCEGISDTATITVSPLPDAELTGPDLVCAYTTGSFSVAASAGCSYTWSVIGGGSSIVAGGGITDTSVTVRWDGSGGTTRVLVRLTNVSGCSSSDTLDVELHPEPNPVLAADGSTRFCEGASVTLTVGPRAFASYAWYDSTLGTSLGHTTGSLTVTESGTFRVIVTDATGCIDTSNALRVTVDPLPVAVALSPEGPIGICGDDSVTITAGTTTEGEIHWSTGATGQSITVTQTGNYSAIVVNPATGCSSAVSNTVRVVRNSMPEVAIENRRPLEFCEGDSTILAVSDMSAIASVLWMPGGQTTDTIHVKASGTVTMTVIDTNGCSATLSVNTSMLPRPTPTLRADTTICQGESITLDAGAGYSTYRWSTGSTSQSIVVSAAGEYHVSVTNASGCEGVSDTVSITVEPLPTADLSGPDLVCAGSTATYSVPGANGIAYLWSVIGDGSSIMTGGGTTDTSVTVKWGEGGSGAGSVSVRLTNLAGCVGYSDTIEVDYQPEPDPVISATDLTVCEGDSVTLTVGPRAFVSYAWYDSTLTTSLNWTGSSLTVGTTGTFRVIVTDVTGCVDTSNALAVTVNPAPEPAVLSPAGPVALCGTDSIVISAEITGDGVVHWSNGQTGSSITVSEAGSYFATVVDPVTGCSSVVSNTVDITRNALPLVVATSLLPLEFCAGDSTILAASETGGIASFLWMPSGKTTDTIHVFGSETVTLIATDTNGCVATSTISTNMLPRPTPTLRGDTTICQGQSITLDAGEGYSSYLWSNGSTTRTLTVTATGDYHVTVGNAAGCQGVSDTATITVVPLPSAELSGPDMICAGTTGVYSVASAAGTTYLWSVSGDGHEVIAGGASNDTSVTVLWGETGTGYVSVRLTNAAGCSVDSDTIEVDRQQELDPVIGTTGSLTFCSGDSVTLNVGPRAFASYAWYDSSLTISHNATGSSLTVGESGSYRVIVTDVTGCIDTSDAVAVVVNPLPSPVVLSPAGPIGLCGLDSVTLTASETTEGEIHWSNGAIGRSISVTETGSYSAIVIDATTGCSSAVSNVVRVQLNASREIVATNLRPLAFCEGDSTILAVSDTTGLTSILWMPSGKTSDTIHLHRSETVTLKVVDTNGCEAISTLDVVMSPRPTPRLGADTTICQGESFELDAGEGYSSYLWSTGSTERRITVSTSGAYHVTVLDESGSGCEGVSDTMQVTVAPMPVATLTGPAEICGSSPVRYSVVGNENTTYIWSLTGDATIVSGGTTADSSVDVRWGTGGADATTISVLLRNVAGCEVASDTITVKRYADPDAVLTPGGDASGALSFCRGDSLTLRVGPRPFARYEWYDADFAVRYDRSESYMTVTETGTYRAVVTDFTGCRDTTNVVAVQVNSVSMAAVVSPAGPISLCGSDSIRLTADVTGDGVIHWSTGETGPSIMVRETGEYSAVVVNPTTGCASPASNVVTVTRNPSLDVVAINRLPLLFCEGDSTILAASDTAGITSYLWLPGGETVPAITVAKSGTFTLTVIDTNGCSATSSLDVRMMQRPTPTLPADTTICEGESIQLDAGDGYSSYLWSNGSTTRWITASTAGEYFVTVTGAGSSCSAVSNTMMLSVAPRPVVSMSGPILVCANSTARYSVPGSAGVIYTWKITGAGRIVSGGSRADTSVDIEWQANGSGVVEVIARSEASGCTASSSLPVTIGTSLKPAVTFSSSTICPGDSVRLDAGSYSTYRWSDAADRTLGTERTLIVKATGIYFIEVADASGCRGKSDGIPVTVAPLASPAITILEGKLDLCPGSTVLLDAGDYASYLWSNGRTSRTLSVSAPGRYAVTVKNAAGCSATSDTVEVTMSIQPSPVLSGPGSVCINSTAIYAVTNPGNSEFLWTITPASAGTIVGATDGESVTVRWGAAMNARIEVLEKSRTSGCSASSPAKRVMIQETLSPDITFDTPLPRICDGGSLVLRSPGYDSYLWTDAAGSTVGTADTLVVTRAGRYTLAVGNGLCTGSSSIMVDPRPAIVPQILPINASTLCPGDSLVVGGEDGFAHYQWSRNGVELPGETGRALVVRTAGAYSVKVVDYTGCSGESDPVSIDLYPGAPIPTITLAGDLLTSSPAASYQWSLDGRDLPGETGRTLQTTVDGLYRVAVTDANGCHAISDPLEWKKEGLVEPARAVVGFHEFQGAPGERIAIPITLRESHNLLENQVGEFTARIRFNRTMLMPMDELLEDILDGDDRIITVSGTLPPGFTGDSTTLLSLDFLVALGPILSTPLEIEAFEWQTNGVTGPSSGSVQVTTFDGRFSVIGLCENGGARLVDASGSTTLKPARPNPARGLVAIEYEVVEDGRTQLLLTDMAGRTIPIVDADIRAGRYVATFDVSNLPSGGYVCVLQTRTQRLVQSLTVQK